MIHTPTEGVRVRGLRVSVKREDLSTPPPGPPFSKIRGLREHLVSLSARGIEDVGYMETSISMAGWGIAYLCSQLRMRATIYYPRYKGGLRHNQGWMMEKWQDFGATIVPLDKPNMQSVNFNRARKMFKQIRPGGIFLPLGLPLSETVDIMAREVVEGCDHDDLSGSIVCCVGSGTMLAGILRGVASLHLSPAIFGILVAQKNSARMLEKVIDRAGILRIGALLKLNIVDAGYEYTTPENYPCRFPCNRYYDRKAWRWLAENVDHLERPVLFWNIGGG